MGDTNNRSPFRASLRRLRPFTTPTDQPPATVAFVPLEVTPRTLWSLTQEQLAYYAFLREAFKHELEAPGISEEYVHLLASEILIGTRFRAEPLVDQLLSLLAWVDLRDFDHPTRYALLPLAANQAAGTRLTMGSVALRTYFAFGLTPDPDLLWEGVRDHLANQTLTPSLPLTELVATPEGGWPIPTSGEEDAAWVRAFEHEAFLLLNDRMGGNTRLFDEAARISGFEDITFKNPLGWFVDRHPPTPTHVIVRDVPAYTTRSWLTNRVRNTLHLAHLVILELVLGRDPTPRLPLEPTPGFTSQLAHRLHAWLKTHLPSTFDVLREVAKERVGEGSEHARPEAPAKASAEAPADSPPETPAERRSGPPDGSSASPESQTSAPPEAEESAPEEASGAILDLGDDPDTESDDAVLVTFDEEDEAFFDQVAATVHHASTNGRPEAHPATITPTRHNDAPEEGLHVHAEVHAHPGGLLPYRDASTILAALEAHEEYLHATPTQNARVQYLSDEDPVRARSLLELQGDRFHTYLAWREEFRKGGRPKADPELLNVYMVEITNHLGFDDHEEAYEALKRVITLYRGFRSFEPTFERWMIDYTSVFPTSDTPDDATFQLLGRSLRSKGHHIFSFPNPSFVRAWKNTKDFDNLTLNSLLFLTGFDPYATKFGRATKDIRRLTHILREALRTVETHFQARHGRGVIEHLLDDHEQESLPVTPLAAVPTRERLIAYRGVTNYKEPAYGTYASLVQNALKVAENIVREYEGFKHKRHVKTTLHLTDDLQAAIIHTTRAHLEAQAGLGLNPYLKPSKPLEPTPEQPMEGQAPREPEAKPARTRATRSQARKRVRVDPNKLDRLETESEGLRERLSPDAGSRTGEGGRQDAEGNTPSRAAGGREHGSSTPSSAGRRRVRPAPPEAKPPQRKRLKIDASKLDRLENESANLRERLVHETNLTTEHETPPDPPLEPTLETPQADTLSESSEATASAGAYAVGIDDDEYLILLDALTPPERAALTSLSAGDTLTVQTIATDHNLPTSLFIDAINEKALDTIGDTLIDTSNDTPELVDEHAEALHPHLH